MQNGINLAIVFLACSIFSGTACSAEEKPFVTVNGVPVSQATVDMYKAQGKANGMPDSPFDNQSARDEAINRELMFQAAKKSGYTDKPEIASQVASTTRLLKAQLDATAQAIVIRAYLEDYLKAHPASEEQLKNAYTSNRDRAGNTEYKASHILLKTESDARSIIDRLNKGEKFDDLIKLSVEPGAVLRRGDLGWASQNRLARPFADAVKKLKKGQYTTQPVKTEFGYHVIKLEDTRPLVIPSFNDMKPILEKEAKEKVIAEFVKNLRTTAKIQ